MDRLEVMATDWSSMASLRHSKGEDHLSASARCWKYGYTDKAASTGTVHTQPRYQISSAAWCSHRCILFCRVEMCFCWQVTKGFVIGSHSSEDGPNQIVDENQRRNASLQYRALLLHDSGSICVPREGSEVLRVERYPYVAGRRMSGRERQLTEQNGRSGTALGWRGLAHVDMDFVYEWQ